MDSLKCFILYIYILYQLFIFISILYIVSPKHQLRLKYMFTRVTGVTYLICG